MSHSASLHLHLPQVFKRQWHVLGGGLAVGLVIATSALFLIQPQYAVQAYVDIPYNDALRQLNLGRSQASGLAAYTPEQAHAYFIRRLTSDGAMQRFFQETYLPAQTQPPASLAAEQALFASMRSKVLRILPPEPKKRALYRIQMTASQGSNAALWATTFLAQVEQDAKQALLKDIHNDIALQIRNTERDLKERLQTTQTLRQDRLAVLDEALRIAQAVGQSDPQITRAQPPRQDGLSSYMDGSQLYARGTKSLQAEINVLKNRKDDAPFLDGLRATESQLRLLEELQAKQPDFSLYHLDGQISAPENPSSPKSTLILLTGILAGTLLGSLIALWREGILQRFLRDESDTPYFPALAPASTILRSELKSSAPTIDNSKPPPRIEETH